MFENGENEGRPNTGLLTGGGGKLQRFAEGNRRRVAESEEGGTDLRRPLLTRRQNGLDRLFLIFADRKQNLFFRLFFSHHFFLILNRRLGVQLAVLALG